MVNIGGGWVPQILPHWKTDILFTIPSIINCSYMSSALTQLHHFKAFGIILVSMAYPTEAFNHFVKISQVCLEPSLLCQQYFNLALLLIIGRPLLSCCVLCQSTHICKKWIVSSWKCFEWIKWFKYSSSICQIRDRSSCNFGKKSRGSVQMQAYWITVLNMMLGLFLWRYIKQWESFMRQMMTTRKFLMTITVIRACSCIEAVCYFC